MKTLNGNQIVAKFILGYVPKGFILVCEKCNSRANYRVGEICIDGKAFASIPASLHGGKLPQSASLA